MDFTKLAVYTGGALFGGTMKTPHAHLCSLLLLFFVSFSAGAAIAEESAVLCPNGRGARTTPINFRQATTILPYLEQDNRFGRAQRFFPYGRANGDRPVRCATGDLNADGVADIITVPGPGSAPIVRVFDGTTRRRLDTPIGEFLAFNSSFRGGVFVAAGDVNGDGTPDIVTGAGSTAGQVNVFNGETAQQILSFFAYDQTFTGGVRVAAGDINGDGRAEIVTGPGMGTDAVVKVFDGQTGQLLQSFVAFDSYQGGVYVAIGETDASGRPDIIVGPGAKSRGLPVKIFNEQSTGVLDSFFAYGENFAGGVTVAAFDFDGDDRAEILTGPARGGRSRVQLFDGATGELLRTFSAYNRTYRGGVMVGLPDSTADPVVTPAPDLTPGP